MMSIGKATGLLMLFASGWFVLTMAENPEEQHQQRDSNIRSLQNQNVLWSEEFSGAALNGNVWTPRLGGGGWGNGELQVYTNNAANVAVVNQERLEISVRREISATDGSVTFTSARIDTRNKVHVQYGTISARVQVPNTNAGLWPAFWTMGATDDSITWPATGEIDIFELGQGLAIAQNKANNRVVSAAHWVFNGTYATYAGSRDIDSDLTSDYYVYTLDWTPTTLATYVNDIRVWTMNIDPTSCKNDCNEFHQPHYLLLNVAVGGGFTSGVCPGGGGGSSGSSGVGSSGGVASSGTTGSSGVGGGSSGVSCGGLRGPLDITAPLPASMKVDWIRIYDNGHAKLTVVPPSSSTILAPPPVAPVPKTPVRFIANPPRPGLAPIRFIMNPPRRPASPPPPPPIRFIMNPRPPSVASSKTGRSEGVGKRDDDKRSSNDEAKDEKADGLTVNSSSNGLCKVCTTTGLPFAVSLFAYAVAWIA